MKSDFLLAFNQICSDRGLPREVVLEALPIAATLIAAQTKTLRPRLTRRPGRRTFLSRSRW
jgi:hypothetical protein